MALAKNVTLNSKFVAAYHRIAGVFILDSQKICEIHLESFKDEATRRELTDEGAPRWAPVAAPVCKISGPAFDALFGEGVPEYPSKSDLYAYLKTEAQFVGATDV